MESLTVTYPVRLTPAQRRRLGLVAQADRLEHQNLRICEELEALGNPCEGLEAAFRRKVSSSTKNCAVTKAIHNLRKGSCAHCVAWARHGPPSTCRRRPANSTRRRMTVTPHPASWHPSLKSG